jgi:lysophospholipase L1-like esterase
MKQGLLSNLLLSLVALLSVATAFECGLRLYGYDAGLRPKEQGDQVFRASAHPDVRFEPTPGSSTTVWGVDVSISSRGLREPEPVEGWDPDRSVVVLGDSIAFGNFLEVESTFPRQLQKALLAEDEDVEILNLGVGGYDTIQEVASLELRGLQYRPDVVVVAYCLNDAGIVSMNLAHFDLLDALENNPLFRLQTVQFLTKRLKRLRLKLWSVYRNNPFVFRRHYASMIDPIGDDEEELLALMETVSSDHPADWYRDRDRVGRLRFAFRRLRDLSREGGFGVVVAIVPWLTGDTEEYHHAAVHRIVELESERAGFDSVDLVAPFMRAGLDGLRIRSADPVHPNEAGHRIIAEALAAYLRTQLKLR